MTADQDSTDQDKEKRVVIVTPNKLLYTKCREITEITPDIVALAHEMEELLRKPQSGGVRPIGISAPQLGECVRMSSFILNPEAGLDTPPDIITLINPLLVYEKGKRTVVETCLSVPGKSFVVKRGKVVKIKGTSLDGTERSLRAHGLVAQLFLHELDHLNGILINSKTEEGE